MPIKLKPSAVALQVLAGHPTKNAVSFSYDFTTDAVRSITMGDLVFQGTDYLLDLSAFQNAKNFKSIKALQIVAQFAVGFEGASARFFDGGLFIYSPATYQLTALGFDTNNPIISLVADIQSVGFVSAVIPITANPPSILQFAKAASNVGDLRGSMKVTAFDFELPAYSSQFLSASISSL